MFAVVKGILQEVKQADKYSIVDVGGHQIAVFGFLKDSLSTFKGQPVVAAVRVSASNGKSRMFTSLRLLDLALSNNALETNYFAGAGVIEAVRQVGKVYEATVKVQGDREYSALVESEQDLTPYLGQQVAFRGYLRANKGFSNLRAKEVWPAGAAAPTPADALDDLDNLAA